MISVNANSIFTNDRMARRVQDVHDNIRSIFKGLTLRETMVVGHNWSSDKIHGLKIRNTTSEYPKLRDLVSFFKRWNYDEDDSCLKDFGLYNRVAIQHARKKVLYLNKIDETNLSQCLDSVYAVSLDNLSKLSLEAYDCGPSITALKFYLVSNYTEEELLDYTGILPSTGPVVRTLDSMFNLSLTQYEQTLFCSKLAAQIGKDTVYVNTALWLLGKEG